MHQWSLGEKRYSFRNQKSRVLCFATVRLSSHRCALMPLFASAYISHPGRWYPVFQSARDCWSHHLWFPRCVRLFPGRLTVSHRTKRKPFPPVVGTFWKQWRGHLSWIHSVDEIWVCHFEWKKKAILGMTPSSVCLKESVPKAGQWVRLWLLSFGTEAVILVDVMPRGGHSTLTYIRMLARNQDVFQTSLSSLKSSRNLDSASQCRASQFWTLRKSSENLVGQCCPIHSTTLFGAIEDAICGEYVWD